MLKSRLEVIMFDKQRMKLLIRSVMESLGTEYSYFDVFENQNNPNVCMKFFFQENLVSANLGPYSSMRDDSSWRKVVREQALVATAKQTF